MPFLNRRAKVKLTERRSLGRNDRPSGGPKRTKVRFRSSARQPWSSRRSKRTIGLLWLPKTSSTLNQLMLARRVLREIAGLVSKDDCRDAEDKWAGFRPHVRGLAELRLPSFQEVVPREYLRRSSTSRKACPAWAAGLCRDHPAQVGRRRNPY